MAIGLAILTIMRTEARVLIIADLHLRIPFRSNFTGITASLFLRIHQVPLAVEARRWFEKKSHIPEILV